MGKKKNKTRVSGAVKTAAKTEKKLAQKLKKELENLGEEDIAKVLAEIEKEEAKNLQPTEKTLKGPPSPRAYATLTPHPINNELIMFGGEYHDGQKTTVYNELLFFNPTNNSWKKLKATGAPPPRSAHQAVSTPANKGELWIFGGEFTSPSETQFHHYKDLWCFSLAEKKWEKVMAPNGPCPRSGHRMVLLGRSLVVFGGYNDVGRDCKYYDDVYTFCLDQRQWTKLAVNGRGPSARSACVMLPAGNDSLVIYGGFSRVKENKVERTNTHTDQFRLVHKNGAYAWKSERGGVYAPAARAGQSAAVAVNSLRGYVFGGVSDVEETEEELRGEMSNELLMLDLEGGKFHQVILRGERREQGAGGKGGGDCKGESETEEVTVVTDEIFTMKLGGASSAPPTAEAPPPAALAPPTFPSPRMSSMAAVQRGILYLYGGVLEKDDKQFYLSDMYSLDLHKLNEWKTIIAQPPLPDWLGSESESGDETGSESGSDTDSDASE